MSCNFSDRFFVIKCGLCIFGLFCQRKHSYSYLLTLTLTHILNHSLEKTCVAYNVEPY